MFPVTSHLFPLNTPTAADTDLSLLTVNYVQQAGLQRPKNPNKYLNAKIVDNFKKNLSFSQQILAIRSLTKILQWFGKRGFQEGTNKEMVWSRGSFNESYDEEDAMKL